MSSKQTWIHRENLSQIKRVKKKGNEDRKEKARKERRKEGSRREKKEGKKDRREGWKGG